MYIDVLICCLSCVVDFHSFLDFQKHNPVSTEILYFFSDSYISIYSTLSNMPAEASHDVKRPEPLGHPHLVPKSNKNSRCWLLIWNTYILFFVLKMYASNSALLTVFNQWMWNFVKCLFSIHEDDPFSFLPSSDTMMGYVNRLTHSLPLDNPSLAFWNNPHIVIGFVSEPLLLTAVNPLDTLIWQKLLRKWSSTEGHCDSWGTWQCLCFLSGFHNWLCWWILMGRGQRRS